MRLHSFCFNLFCLSTEEVSSASFSVTIYVYLQIASLILC
jgi:hypothetical protein